MEHLNNSEFMINKVEIRMVSKQFTYVIFEQGYAVSDVGHYDGKSNCFFWHCTDEIINASTH